MRSDSDQTIGLHITLQATLENDKWISLTRLTPPSVVCSSPLRGSVKGLLCTGQVTKLCPHTLDWLPSVTKLFVFKILTLEGFMLIHVLIQILSFVVKSFSLNKDPQQGKVVKIGKCPEGLSWDFYHHQ